MNELPNGSDNTPPAPGLDLRSLIHGLLEKAWLIVLCLVIILFLTGAYLMRAPRIYAATAVLQVEQEEQKVVKIEKIQTEDLRSLDVLRTIEHTLRSRSNLERVVETNNLMNDPRLADPETGRPLTKDKMVDMLSKMVSVKLKRGTRLIDVTVLSTIPDLTDKIANSLITQFIRQNVEQNATSSQVANEFLVDEAQRLRRKLQDSENALQTYKEKSQSVSLEERQNIVVQKLKELSVTVTEAESARIKLESDYAQVQRLGTNVQELLIVPAVANDKVIAALLADLSKLEADFGNMKQRYKAKHPEYIQAVAQLAERKQQLQEAVLKVPQTLRSSYDSAMAAEGALKKALAEQESAALGLNKSSIQYNVLAREVESDRVLYDSVLQRLKETALTKGMPLNTIRVIEQARTPTIPIKPQKTKILILGIFAGLVVGVMLVMLLNSLDTSFKTVDQTEGYLGLPVLSVVPQMKDISPNESQLIVVRSPKSNGAEAFRSLRASLAMLGRDEERRTFLLTSALPQEGKTFCSVNYAASVAQNGFRTILIDGDLRRPAVAAALGGESEKKALGVTNFLTGKATLDEITQKTEVPNLWFISAGTTAPNPAELLNRNAFDVLVDEALKSFDRVVVDSAPIHAVSDTLLMLNRIQTVCVVARTGKTSRKVVSRAIQILQKGGAPISGIILNRFPRQRGLNYYNSYYDYSYRGKYAEKGVYGEV